MQAPNQFDADVVDAMRPEATDDTELRESLKAYGWNPEFPAIKDELGVTLVGNRRLRLATELNIAPKVKELRLGTGEAADAERVKLALISNIGGKPVTREGRKRLAKILDERGWTQQRIGDALRVDQRTVGRDLEPPRVVTLGTVPNVDRAVAPEPPPAPKPAKLDTLGRVRSPGRPPGSKNKPKPPHGTNDNAMRTSTPKTPPKPIETLDERGRTAIIDIRGVAVEDWNAFGQIAFNEGKHPPTKVAEMITDYVSSGTVGGIPHKVLKAKLTPIIDELETFARQKPGTISNGSVSHTAARIRNLLKEWREAGASASATPERSAKSTVAGMKGSLNNV